MIGTSEYMSVDSNGGGDVTGLFVATETHNNKFNFKGTSQTAASI